MRRSNPADSHLYKSNVWKHKNTIKSPLQLISGWINMALAKKYTLDTTLRIGECSKIIPLANGEA